LGKGDWSDTDIFFRGAGDIIGATKIDEAILAEMLREEDAGVEYEDVIEEDALPMEVTSPPMIVDTTAVDTVQEVNINQDADEQIDEQSNWFGLGGGEEE
jgi:hypothetical protein